MRRKKNFYDRHFGNVRRERALLSAIGFTATFATARAITHSIRAGIGPFGNIEPGGKHIHHSTFGIIGLLACGYVWTYQLAIGTHPHSDRWASRVSAASYGIASALTLDEFALWFDLKDDYWNKQGRKSIDAVALFGGLLTIGLAGRSAIVELLKVERTGTRKVKRRR